MRLGRGRARAARELMSSRKEERERGWEGGEGEGLNTVGVLGGGG